ncbi:hypothetical protein [Patulibacter sp. SYSU D01012]|uniref:hypothetical protein n=1 Tax=Patulibacter sp. SYSU D01012 TaxID=2817381 RepID=UPI001B30BB6C|nr:hypothetical protein [Patulibacter sp. SYSU D01012]
MASIHITEIQRLLADRGERDAVPHVANGQGYFVEIRFDGPGGPTGVVDEELADAVITAESAYGMATIQFDAEGSLFSIDLS